MSNSNFYMAVDEGGYDGRTFVFCVFAKKENEFVEVYQSHDEKAFKQSFFDAIDKYLIPPEQILDAKQG